VPAAVLVPLFLPRGAERLHDVHAVFTRRREDLRRHAGEISFPGGRPEQGDGSLVATALRETEEEVGLPSGAVEVLGALPPVSTFVTGYLIHPFVGAIPSGQAWTLSPHEVDEVLELPLAEVRDSYAIREILRRGVRLRTATYAVADSVIWGATARIVAALLERWEAALAA
jgi:8-oxo-dGTP pyrophosphatase MutT (NUDIX family)